jgi:hypothetical protein
MISEAKIMEISSTDVSMINQFKSLLDIVDENVTIICLQIVKKMYPEATDDTLDDKIKSTIKNLIVIGKAVYLQRICDCTSQELQVNIKDFMEEPFKPYVDLFQDLSRRFDPSSHNTKIRQ